MMEDMQEKRGMMHGYTSLAVQTVLSGIIMYLVMFVIIDGLDSFYNNLNMLYMTLMMWPPLVVLLILASRHKFSSKPANIQIISFLHFAFTIPFSSRRNPWTYER